MTPMLRMSWSTERPYPWLQPAVEHLALLSAPTSFFPRIEAWTAVPPPSSARPAASN
ncbi:MAG: hypothetical protein R3F17_11815 [Planctomycetota bacterium]